MTAPVWVRYTKWNGDLSWHFPMVRLGGDRHGTWLGAPDGTPVRRGAADPIRSPAFVLLVPENAWWTAVWNDPVAGMPFPYLIYADVCSPARWSDAGVTMVDLDLDVVLGVDGSVSIRDEDEFDAHAAAWGYPPATRHHARTAAVELLEAFRAHTPPFDDTALAHLGAARRLPSVHEPWGLGVSE